MMHGEGVSVLLWGRTLDLWGRRPQLEDLGLQGYPRASASGTGSGGWAWGLCGWARGVQGWQGPWGTVSRLPHVQQAWCPLSFTGQPPRRPHPVLPVSPSACPSVLPAVAGAVAWEHLTYSGHSMNAHRVISLAVKRPVEDD